MTFVKAKLHLERLKPGETTEILLLAGEPLENVPRAAADQGYQILETVRVEGDVYRVTVRKPEQETEPVTGATMQCSWTTRHLEGKNGR